MADLKRTYAFRRWAPDIGENRDALSAWEKSGEKGPCPGIYLELATGLTPEQLGAISVRMSVPLPATVEGDELLATVKDGLRLRYLEAFCRDYVRVVDAPHSVAGKELSTPEDYLRIVEEQADFGKLAVTDLLGALVRFNSFTGPDELFLQRRSGGSASTGGRSVVKAEPPTEGP